METVTKLHFCIPHESYLNECRVLRAFQATGKNPLSPIPSFAVLPRQQHEKSVPARLFQSCCKCFLLSLLKSIALKLHSTSSLRMHAQGNANKPADNAKQQKRQLHLWLASRLRCSDAKLPI